MYSNIPIELRRLNQWIIWRLEKVNGKNTKVPYNATTGKLASVTDPSTWSSFDDCIQSTFSKSGIGFVFTDSDDFSFIDLDNTHGDEEALARQIKIYETFDTYSEISPSGNGLHLIVKGKVPQGRRRNYIEIYSNNRYATFTGNVYGEKYVIQERQQLLTQLWEEMGSQPINFDFKNVKEIYHDEEIIRQANNAINGDKFQRLYQGKWDDIYPSQSEADFAFIDILAFYTQNTAQIERIFRSTPLGIRNKAKRSDYVQRMIQRSFDKQLPPVDIEGFKIAVENKMAAVPPKPKPYLNGKGDNHSTTPDPKPLHYSIPLPPGLLGEIARFIYDAAPRPVPEIALAAAIGLMAGICGRAYNISQTGLNQYILLLAKTGSGKESISSGIDKLINAVKIQVPTADEFIGPSEIRSGQALVKYLNKTPCFVSILGEFGLRLEQMSNPKSLSSEKELRRMFLDVYQKSGKGQTYKPSIYADSSKNISVTNSPSFSILGESTPERFYNNLTEDMISDGLLPRFTIIEYLGKRPKLNENHSHSNPSHSLVQKMVDLTSNTSLIMHSKSIVEVTSSYEATTMLRKFNDYCDNYINSSDKEIFIQLWNRAHLKVLKLSALIAIGVNPYTPEVCPQYVEWAIDLVKDNIEKLAKKFEEGDIGSHSENNQLKEIKRVVNEYIVNDWEKVEKYCTDAKLLHKDSVIPYSYISRRVISIATFKNDRNGSTIAIKRVIQYLLDTDYLKEVPKIQMSTKYSTSQRAFVIKNLEL